MQTTNTESIKNLLNSAVLKIFESPTPRLDAEILLSKTLGKRREYLNANPEIVVEKGQVATFNKLISRRAQNEPIAYITGHKEFYGYEFIVTKDVLIPRPETEILVDTALEILRKREIRSVVDIGTGSGCIVLSIAKALSEEDPTKAKEIHWIATDKSIKAIQVAERNFQEILASTNIRIQFLQGDLLSPIPEKVDLLLSNPPYVPISRYETLDTNVRDYEPKEALLAGAKGMRIISRVLSEAKALLNESGTIILEIHYNQGNKVRSIAQKQFPGASVEITKDYSGFDRIVVIKT